MREMKIAVLFVVVGLSLMVINELTKSVKTRVVYKYIPRDMDTYFKDPENQPMYVYRSMFNDENVRMF